MFGKSKPQDTIKPKSYVVKTTITKSKDKYNISDEYFVKIEGSGFEGNGSSASLSMAFSHAYDDLMVKVSESIFQED